MSLPIFLPCAAGVESFALQEVQRLIPEAQAQSVRGGVSLSGGAAEVMRLNLHCRLPQRVLVEVARTHYSHERDLYDMAAQVEWDQWITPQQTLKVDTTSQRSPLKSLQFAALLIKDAVCDTLRQHYGERPSVDTHQPDLPLVLHLGPQEAVLYVDSSGEALFKRGWRFDKGDAPLKETLAASMLAAASWEGEPDRGGALHDPCCGSGTLAIEAAMIACRKAPGMNRRFAFERQLPFQEPDIKVAWALMRQEARAAERPSPVPIHASDIAFRMVDFAKRNAERAGVAQYIEFHGGDALERPAPQLPPGMKGTLILNPPYGERIEVGGKAARPSAQDRDTGEDFFSRLAAHWKKAYTQPQQHWTAWILSPDMQLPSAMRLKAAQRVPMWNGPIECRLFRFDLVAGSMRPGDAQ